MELNTDNYSLLPSGWSRGHLAAPSLSQRAWDTCLVLSRHPCLHCPSRALPPHLPHGPDTAQCRGALSTESVATGALSGGQAAPRTQWFWCEWRARCLDMVGRKQHWPGGYERARGHECSRRGQIWGSEQGLCVEGLKCHVGRVTEL